VKEIYVDGVLETIESANYWHSSDRKDYTVAQNGTGSGVDDPDQQFYENTRAARRATTADIAVPSSTRKFDEQSKEADQEKRKKLVWEIDKKLQEDAPGRSSSTTAQLPAGSPR